MMFTDDFNGGDSCLPALRQRAFAKNGHTQQSAQRARCVECQRTFTLEPKGPRYDQKFRDQVLAAYQDRMSLRGVRRTFGVCYKTVIAWLGEKTESLPTFKDTLLPGQNGDALELDELWSFVGARSQTLWLWVALCRRTRQIVGWTLGDRSLQSACDLRAALPKGYRQRATRSDFWEAYRTAFPVRTHRCCASAWAASYGKPFPFPNAPKTTSTPSTSSSSATISKSSNQHSVDHYRSIVLTRSSAVS